MVPVSRGSSLLCPFEMAKRNCLLTTQTFSIICSGFITAALDFSFTKRVCSSGMQYQRPPAQVFSVLCKRLKSKTTYQAQKDKSFDFSIISPYFTHQLQALPSPNKHFLLVYSISLPIASFFCLLQVTKSNFLLAARRDNPLGFRIIYLDFTLQLQALKSQSELLHRVHGIT